MKQEFHKGQKGKDCLVEVGLGELWTEAVQSDLNVNVQKAEDCGRIRFLRSTVES